MSTLTWITLAGLVAVVVLFSIYTKLRSRDTIEEFMKKRRGMSKLVSRADFLEGLDRVPVALAVDDSAIRYENTDLNAFIDLALIDEVEYDNELQTGKEVSDGKVLRLRAHGTAFEFVLENELVSQWQKVLPAHETQRSAHAS